MGLSVVGFWIWIRDASKDSSEKTILPATQNRSHLLRKTDLTCYARNKHLFRLLQNLLSHACLDQNDKDRQTPGREKSSIKKEERDCIKRCLMVEGGSNTVQGMLDLDSPHDLCCFHHFLMFLLPTKYKSRYGCSKLLLVSVNSTEIPRQKLAR
jgi:hypothetical protein